MPGKYLLDTNIVIALFSGERQISERLGQAEIFVASTVLGELYYGARKSAHRAANLAKVEQFATAIEVLSSDAVTARLYGEVKERLRTKGRPIPENDIWIAAAAIQHHLILATRDEHFAEIDNLSREKW